MSATDYLRLVYLWLPGAFLIDLMTLTLAVWIAKVWRVRKGKR